MDDSANRYAAWKAPQEDGSVLIWPDSATLLNDARRTNRRLTEASALVQNKPLHELRRQLRQFLGIQDDQQLLLATGHQTELHHPGVWAKNLLIDAVAARTGGVAMHVAVDTDAPKHLSLRFPGYSQPFTDDPAATSADWGQLVAPPTPVHLAKLLDDVLAASKAWSAPPAIEPIFDICRRLSLEAETLPSLLTAALHEYDWSMGLRYSALLASPIWISAPFMAFAYHLLSRADRFAADYNAALAAYRTRNHIRTPGRPMPELTLKDGRCETPFWRDDQTRGRRVRAWVERSGDKWALAVGDDRLELDPTLPAEIAVDRLTAFLRRHNLRLAPRALTLTMTLRLLATDQFVHGIGGGQYDQVTDDIITRHFGLEPPRFCVTTATLYWPGAAGKTRTSLPTILSQGHRLKHALLGDRKQQYVAAIEAAPRNSTERQLLFQQMQGELANAAKTSPEMSQWQQTLRESSARIMEERSIFDRELFYPLQPRDRLEKLIETYRRM